MRSFWAVVSRVPVSLGYVAALTAVSVVLAIRGPQARQQAVEHASTNLHNLSHGHLGTLVSSAFVTEVPVYMVAPGMLCVLAVNELQWGGVRLAANFILGHVGGTLIVASLAVLALRLQWAERSIARDSDVGMSYGTAAALGALVAALPRGWRAPWMAGWITVGTVSLVCNRTFTDAGHLTAMLLGAAAAYALPPGRPQWNNGRRWLLRLGAAFGVGMFAQLPLTIAAAVPAGAVAVALTRRISRRPRERAATA